jgi:hypothetical protein
MIKSYTHLCTCLSACQYCTWVPVGEGLPEKGGKYLVKTESIFMKSVNRFDAVLVVSDTKKTWNVSNQVVTHWLDESHTHLCTCLSACQCCADRSGLPSTCARVGAEDGHDYWV